MSLRGFSVALAVALLSGGVVLAQGQDSGAIRKLAFLSGSWHCAVGGTGVPKGVVDHLSYEFSPDWSWMIERSRSVGNAQTYWSAQLWGYDAHRKQLVAYKFDSTGVSTKSVDGWVGDRFLSKRDDNGATVSITPVNSNTFKWVIESADHSSVVTEVCTR